MREAREWELEGYRRARLQRGQLGLGAGPIGERIYRILEESGIFVLGRPIPDAKLSGAFFRVSDEESLIVINHARTLGHQRFTAAHELSHFLYDRDLDNKIESLSDQQSSRDPREVAANAFADEFMMPSESPRIMDAEAEMIRKGGPKPEIIISLQQHFGVSYRAMARRLFKLGKLTSTQWEALRGYQAMRRLTLDLGYSTQLLDAWNETYASPAYVALASGLYRKGGISSGRLETFLADVGRDMNSLDLNGGPIEDNVDDYRSMLVNSIADGTVDDGEAGPA